jgi:hypothetical protein
MRMLRDMSQTSGVGERPGLDELIALYQSREVMGAEATSKIGLGNGPIQYYFWSAGSHRLMICAVSNRRGGYNVTVAMGDEQIMDAIGANAEKAQADTSKAEALIEKKKRTSAGGA